jgi:exosortase
MTDNNTNSATLTKLNIPESVRHAGLSFGLLLVVYSPVLVDLVSDWWNDSNYSHGFLIPLVSGFLLWKKKDRLVGSVGSSSKLGLPLLGFALLLFVLGSAGAEYFTVRVSFIFAMAGLVLFHFGTSFLRSIWFELGFLFFMIPLPYVIYYSLTFPMQLFATKVSLKALEIIGIPAVQQGNIIHLSGISLEVAEACSGIRSMLSLLALGAIYSYFSQSSPVKRGALFLSTIPITVIVNSVRVFITAVLAFTIGAEVTEEPLHSLLGLSVFVMAFVLLLIVNALLSRKKSDT